MLVKAYHTRKILPGEDLFEILSESLPKDLLEKSVVAITSKIIALCEGRVADPEKTSRDELAEKEADYYLPRETNPFDVMLTIKENVLVASAGIDQSNGNGQLVLWPQNVQKSANEIREWVCSHFNLREVGVIVTDSRLSPLRWGVTGICLAHSGFEYLNNYIGKPDVFGRILKVEKVNVADTLAASAVGVMGEGSEQTPLSVITDADFVKFTGKNPTQEELDMLKMDMKNEVFTPLLTSVEWKKGK